MMQNTDGAMDFLRSDVSNRFRYYTRTVDQEMYQMKRFNLRGALTALHGVSMLQSIYYEIEQYINSGVHNLSLLERGGSLSGVLSTDNDLSMLTDDQRQELTEQVTNFFAGAKNAGRRAFFDKGMKYQEFGQTNKDMDYFELKKHVESVIYKRFKIPLPIVDTSTMTMANREQAQLAFYDEVILPLLDRLYGELTMALMYRYKSSEDLIITYDISKIPALEPRKLDQLVKLNGINVLTKDEERAVIGYEEVDGGSVIMIPANLVPLGEPESDIMSETKNRVDRTVFIKLMREQLRADGTRQYTDDEINIIATSEGLK